MGVFSQSIPDVPENLKKSDYAITFNSNSSVYCLYSGIKTVTLKDEFDCFSANYGYYQCLLPNNLYDTEVLLIPTVHQEYPFHLLNR